MTQVTNENVLAAVQGFDLPGEFVSACPCGNGHINHTFAATFRHHGEPVRYILQRINHSVFRDPAGLMRNLGRVTAHLRAKCAARSPADFRRRSLELIPARDGTFSYRDDAGYYWRAYVFIEGATTFDVVQTPAQAFEAGRAFGDFQVLLTDLAGERLVETIPQFHHAALRFANLEKAIAADVANRAASARAEIDFALRRKPMTDLLLQAHARGEIPERIIHNDTKFNNVMLDDDSQQALCVIDLDTVMPGFVHYDFGDMVRTTTSVSREDERDLSKISVQMPMFHALARGYLSAAGAFLTAGERAYLAFGGKLITFTIGIRFLTDYLAGDTYFRIHYPEQNLDRCRAQLKLVESIERHESSMQKFINQL